MPLLANDCFFLQVHPYLKYDTYIAFRWGTMGSATTLLSRMRRRVKTILTLSTWRTQERRTSRKKSSSESRSFSRLSSLSSSHCPYYFAAKACCCACWATCWRSSPTRPSSSPSQSPTGSASSGSADQNILFETLASRLERARRW